MSTPPIGQAPGQAPASQTTLREFLAVIFRRRWLILGLFFVVTATVLAITITTPTMYGSSGRVLVTRGERESALTGRVQILNDWEQDLASEVAKVHGTAVIGRARELLAERAKRTGRVPPPIVAARMDVQVMGKSNVMAIGYDDLVPERAQEVCDALLTAYLEYRQETPLGETDSVFAVQLSALRRQIDVKTAMRESIATSSGVNDPTSQMGAWNAQTNALEQRRDEASADLAAAESRVASMHAMQQHPDVDMPTLGGDSQSRENALTGLKQKITDQQARIAMLRERYRDDSPEVTNALETLETLRALLRREVDQELGIEQARVDQLHARLAVYNHDVNDLRVHLSALPRNQKALEELDAEIKTLRQRNDEYVKARDQARITADVSQNVTVVLLNPAGPAEPKNARDVVRVLLAPIFSLVVGVGLAFFMDGLDLTVRTAGQAEAYLDLPVLATLPERRKRRS